MALICFNIRFDKNRFKVKTENSRSGFVYIYSHIYIPIYDYYKYIIFAFAANSKF